MIYDTLPYEQINRVVSHRELITYRTATAWIDREILDRVVALNRHHSTEGRRAQPYWHERDLAELLELVAIETAGGGSR